MFCVVTWNLKNFFEPKNQREETLTHLKLRDMGQALRDMKAHVVCVQEVGSPAMLERLAMAWRPGGDATTRLGVPDDRGIACGIMSRAPVSYAGDHHPDSLAGGMRRPKRGAVHVQVQVEDRALDVLCFHFKSRLPTLVGDPTLSGDERSNVWRAAEAASLHEYARTLVADSRSGWVLLAGDANDEPHSATLHALCGDLFAEVVALEPEDKRATCMHQGQPMTLDHMALSPALVACTRELKVHNEKLRDHGPLLGAARVTVDSDHAAVSVRIFPTETVR